MYDRITFKKTWKNMLCDLIMLHVTKIDGLALMWKDEKRKSKTFQLKSFDKALVQLLKTDS